MDRRSRWIDTLIDVLGIVGLGLLAYGLWWVYWPLAFIVPGGLLVLLALASAWRRWM